MGLRSAGVLAAHVAAPNSAACRWLRDLRNPCEHSVGREQLSLLNGAVGTRDHLVHIEAVDRTLDESAGSSAGIEQLFEHGFDRHR